MRSLEWNRVFWGTQYDWRQQGEEWSEVWGGVESQWLTTIYPRVRHFLSAGRILEIAPGYGRWSAFLIPQCDEYFGIDIAESCIENCKTRFIGADHAHFCVNDGWSFPMVKDHSIDFVFSFDSLVHVEAETIDAYLAEFARVLADDGVGFLHHSNLGAHLKALRFSRVLQKYARGRSWLKARGLIGFDHARAESMTAERFVVGCQRSGLVCIGQEIIDWGHISRKTIDCISLVTRPGSRWERPNIRVANPHFMGEAISSGNAATVYDSCKPV
jgi:SAM-dependent methyltransferase